MLLMSQMKLKINHLDWGISQATLDSRTLGIPTEILPKIVCNAEIIGRVSNAWMGLFLKSSVTSMLLCLAKLAESRYWTGGFHTYECRRGGNRVQPSKYAVEGSIAIAGAAEFSG